MTSTAMVHVPQKQRAVVYTPFGRFVSVLQERFDQSSFGHDGYRWSSLEIMPMLCDGLWPVLMRVADKIGGTVQTPSGVQRVSVRLDRVINAALVLRYPSMHEAADAFERDVIRAVLQELQDLHPDDVVAGSEVWQLPVARFFASLLKDAAKASSRIKSRACELEALNSLGFNEHYDSGETIARAHMVSDCLSLETAMRVAPDGDHYSSGSTIVNYGIRMSESSWHYEFIANYEQKLNAYAQRLEVVRQLPVALGRLPESVRDVGSIIVTEKWLTTQMICAVAGVDPRANHLVVSDIALAKEALSGKSDEQVVDMFVARMIAAGGRFSQEQLPQLRQLAEHSLVYVRKILSSEGIDFQAASGMLLQIEFEEMTFGAEHALNIALGESPGTLTVEGDAELFSDRQVEYLRQNVVGSIAWSEVSADTVSHMIDVGVLPTALVVEGIAQMHGVEQSMALAFVVANTDESVAQRAAHHIADCIPVSRAPRVFFKKFHLFPKEYGLELLRHYLLPDQFEDSVSTIPTFKGMPALLLALDPVQLRVMVEDDPQARLGLVRLLFSELIVSLSIDDEGMLLAEHLGSDLWIRLLLGADIILREGELLDDAPSDPELSRLAGWDDLTARERNDSYLMGWLESAGALAAEVLSLYPEQEIARWIFAGEDDPDKSFKRYMAARDNYFS